MNRVKEIVSGSAFVLIGILLLIKASSIKIIPRSGVSSAVFPRIIAWAILIIASIYVILAIVRQKKADVPVDEKPVEKKQTFSEFINGKGVILITFVLITAYAFLLSRLGFILSTVLYLIGQIFLLATARQRKRWWFILLIAIVVAVGVYYAFYYGFHLMLPKGILR